MFKTCDSNHQAGKHALLLNLPFYFKLEALQTLILTVLDVEGAPEQAYPSRVWFFDLSFFRLGPTLGASVTWSLLSPARLRKARVEF